MSDPLETAFDEFADAVEQQLVQVRQEIRTLREENEALRTEVRSAPTATVEPLRIEPVPGPQGERGADGVGIASLAIEDGALVVRTTDGAEHNLGRIVGRDGEPGAPGEPGPQGERGADSTVPGPPGERGADGVATREELESLIETRFTDLQMRSFADVYRGVYRSGDTYQRGELSTWDGNLFLCLADTVGAPGTTPDWRLVARKGRNGRDRTQ